MRWPSGKALKAPEGRYMNAKRTYLDDVWKMAMYVTVEENHVWSSGQNIYDMVELTTLAVLSTTRRKQACQQALDKQTQGTCLVARSCQIWVSEDVARSGLARNPQMENVWVAWYTITSCTCLD